MYSTFWFGFLLLLAFAVKISIFTVLPQQGIKGLILPSFALAVPIICSTIRVFPPVVTLFCQYLGYLIAGSAVVESVFSLNGIGTYLIACITAMDTTAVATCMVIIAAIFVAANLIGDIVNILLCPWIARENNVL